VNSDALLDRLEEMSKPVDEHEQLKGASMTSNGERAAPASWERAAPTAT
jgi:hypothetical protein